MHINNQVQQTTGVALCRASGSAQPSSTAHAAAVREAKARDLAQLAELLAQGQGQGSWQEMSRREQAKLSRVFSEMGLDLGKLMGTARAKSAPQGIRGMGQQQVLISWSELSGLVPVGVGG